MYGIYYLMISTFANFFAETYHFNLGVAGLTYLGLGVGFFLASIFGAKFADNIYKYVSCGTRFFCCHATISSACG